MPLTISRAPGEAFWLETSDRRIRVEVTAITNEKAELRVEAFTVIPRVCRRQKPVIIAMAPNVPAEIRFGGRDGKECFLIVDAPTSVHVVREELLARDVSIQGHK